MRFIVNYLDRQSQFELYVLYMALTIAGNLLLGYDVFSEQGWVNSFWFVGNRGSDLDVFHPLTFGIQFWSFWRWGPGPLVIAEVLLSLVLVIKPWRRVTAILFSVLLLFSIQFHETISVLTNYIIVFSLGLALFPQEEVSSQRSFILTGTACGWFLSAVQKFNGPYLSGNSVLQDLSRAWRFYWKDILANPVSSQVVSVLGVIVELFAGLIAFGGRKAFLGFVAVMLFSAGIMLQINGGHGVFKFFFGLVFLLEFPWAKTKTFLVLVCLPWVMTFVLHPESILSGFPTEVFLGLFLTYVFFMVTFVFFQVWKGKTASKASRGISHGAFVLCMSYAILVRVFYLPTPLGWTQYSLYDTRAVYLVYLEKQREDPCDRLNPNIWDEKHVILGPGRCLLATFSQKRVKNLIEFLCEKGILSKVLQESMAWKQFRELYLDPDLLSSHFDQKANRLESMTCSGVFENGGFEVY